MLRRVVIMCPSLEAAHGYLLSPGSSIVESWICDEGLNTDLARMRDSWYLVAESLVQMARTVPTVIASN